MGFGDAWHLSKVWIGAHVVVGKWTGGRGGSCLTRLHFLVHSSISAAQSMDWKIKVVALACGGDRTAPPTPANARLSLNEPMPSKSDILNVAFEVGGSGSLKHAQVAGTGQRD